MSAEHVNVKTCEITTDNTTGHISATFGETGDWILTSPDVVTGWVTTHNALVTERDDTFAQIQALNTDLAVIRATCRDAATALDRATIGRPNPPLALIESLRVLAGPRTNTPPRPRTAGGTTLTVHAHCPRCDRDLGDATPAELEAFVAGAGLDVLQALAIECGCS